VTPRVPDERVVQGGSGVDSLLRASDRIDRAMRVVVWIGAIMLAGMVIAIATEIVTRRFRMEIPMLGPARLLELEWHFHAALFMLTLGFAYNHNVHVRIDMLVTRTSDNFRAWLELGGIILFLVPFGIALTMWSYGFWLQSWRFNEMSDISGGLPARWVVKTVMPIGTILLLIAGISNAMRLIAFIYGDAATRAAARPAMITEDVVLIEAPSIKRER
jgi:TRAP-type mannitol/chloroaromatic compound transport system permease small subunit